MTNQAIFELHSFYENFELEVAAEYLVMASTLLEIKADASSKTKVGGVGGRRSQS